MQQLAGAVAQWQDERGAPFAYNGRPLQDTLDTMLKELQEEPRQRVEHAKKQVELTECPANELHVKHGCSHLWPSLQQEGVKKCMSVQISMCSS